MFHVFCHLFQNDSKLDFYENVGHMSSEAMYISGSQRMLDSTELEKSEKVMLECVCQKFGIHKCIFVYIYYLYCWLYCSNPIANALELLQSCTKPSKSVIITKHSALVGIPWLRYIIQFWHNPVAATGGLHLVWITTSMSNAQCT